MACQTELILGLFFLLLLSTDDFEVPKRCLQVQV